MSGFDSVAVAQYTDDGQVAYLSCEIKDGEIEWKATSLPYYGILAAPQRRRHC